MSVPNLDPHYLARFLDAQEGVYAQALAEIKTGQKRTHWIWFIFPQIRGLGNSPTSQFYAIQSLEEARAYLAHPILGQRLVACAEALLSLEGCTAAQIFGWPDELKLKSSMTLFAQASLPESVFGQVLEKYYRGDPDARTLDILSQ